MIACDVSPVVMFNNVDVDPFHFIIDYSPRGDDQDGRQMFKNSDQQSIKSLCSTFRIKNIDKQSIKKSVLSIQNAMLAKCVIPTLHQMALSSANLLPFII